MSSLQKNPYLIAVIAALALAPGVAKAGKKNLGGNVLFGEYISPRQKTFSGQLGGVRRTADSIQSIHCSYNDRPIFKEVQIYCQATDNTGKSRGCTFKKDNPKFQSAVIALSTMTPISFISVSYDDNVAGYPCTGIFVSNDSQNDAFTQ